MYNPSLRNRGRTEAEKGKEWGGSEGSIWRGRQEVSCDSDQPLVVRVGERP